MKKIEELTILHLDDSFSALDHFKKDAARYSLTKVVSTNDPNVAVDFFRNNHVDVFLSDFNLTHRHDNPLNIFQQVREWNKEVGLFIYTPYLIESKFFNLARSIDVMFLFKTNNWSTIFDAILQHYNVSKSKEVLLYKNYLIEKLSTYEAVVIPETTGLITDIKTINRNYIDLIQKSPKIVHELSPRQFEELTAELFEKRGYQVTLTPSTRDGGKDLIVLQNTMLGNFLIYTECKKYSPEHPVGVRVVRDLLGAITADRVTAGIIVSILRTQY